MKDPRPLNKPKKERAPGEIPENRIPIFDHKDNMRGHVTKAATAATVARFIGHHGAKLGTKEGRQAWIADPPPPPPPMPDIIIDGKGGAGAEAGGPPSKGAQKSAAKGSAQPTKSKVKK